MKNMQIILLIASLLFFSCISEKRKKPIDQLSSDKNIEQMNHEDLKTDDKTQNCFVENDLKKISDLLDKIQLNCNENISNKKFLTDTFIKKFQNFPCELFLETERFGSVPEFEIDAGSENCDILSIYFNYNFIQKYENEEYSSEKTFILYLVKKSQDKIQIESFGVSG